MFWKILKPTKKDLIPLKSPDDNVMSPEECCTLLNNAIVSSFSHPPSGQMLYVCNRNFFPMNAIAIDSVGVMRVIRILKFLHAAVLVKLTRSF